jgi:hypothetical protein
MSNNNNLKRLNILLRTISKINQQLVISSDEKKLCQKICHYLIRIKGYKFVWMGLKESNNDEITPVAIAGKDKDFVRYIKNSWNKYGFNGCPTVIMIFLKTCLKDFPIAGCFMTKMVVLMIGFILMSIRDLNS